VLIGSNIKEIILSEIFIDVKIIQWCITNVLRSSIKQSLFFSYFNKTQSFFAVYEKSTDFKFNRNHSDGSRVIFFLAVSTDEQNDRRTRRPWQSLFANFENAPQVKSSDSSHIPVQLYVYTTDLQYQLHTLGKITYIIACPQIHTFLTESTVLWVSSLLSSFEPQVVRIYSIKIFHT